jgi:uncharacterized protein YcfJ
MEENKDISKSLLGKSTDGYREGAIAGGLVGLVIAAYLRKNIMYGILIGLVGGGYIGYLSKNSDNEQKFTKPKN